MNRQQAEELVTTIKNLLTGKKLVSVSVGPFNQRRPEVRVDQTFRNAYFVEHADGSCVVAISDSYGVMTGAEDWSVDRDRKTIHARTTNAYGELCQFSWTIQEPTEEDCRNFSNVVL